METYDVHIYIQHPYLANIALYYHSLFLKFRRQPKFKILKLWNSAVFCTYVNFYFSGMLCNACPELEQTLKMERKDSVFTINKKSLIIILQFFIIQNWHDSNCHDANIWSLEHSRVWIARDSNLRWNYESVLTWHKMYISEVSVMANKSIVRHPQAKLLIKQIWHSIKFTLYMYVYTGTLGLRCKWLCYNLCLLLVIINFCHLW